MIDKNRTHNADSADAGAADYDAVVIGAGFGGMYALLRLREAGFRTRVYETARDVGGTWYWNRYPGCRCDVESMQYSYSFDETLQQEWDWSERYSPQPEILAYANHVADRFDLRRDIEFETTVQQASFDEQNHLWRVVTNDGKRVSTRYLVTAIGCLSATNRPHIDGHDTFSGGIYHTGEWPHEGVDFSNRRVGVVGTGSSGVQSIPHIAAHAKSLHVFQRTANFIVPARNRPLEIAERDAIKSDYAGLRAKGRQRPTGFFFDYNDFSALDVDKEERRRLYEKFWQNGGLTFLGVFNDLLVNQESNDTAAEFVREKIRAIVNDPQTADLLAPSDIIGCKRLCADSGYFETFNMPHVNLVDISKTPISHLTKNALVVDDREYELDDIVYATGFDAMTGAFLRIDIRGRSGLSLKDKWEHGPRSYMGISIEGFPNLFTMTGPGSPSVFANLVLGVEQHADWIVDCLDHMRDQNLVEIEATRAAEDTWVEHNREVGERSLRSTCQSWYVGSNVPGKPKVFSPYIGGFPIYTKKIEAVAANNYEGFSLSSATTPGSNPSV